MKKAAKIVLLAVLLAMVGGIVYAVMVRPVNPTRMKPAESYEQLRDTVEKKTDIRVPGEDLLPWTVTERQLRMDGPSRLAKVSGFALSGTMERGGVAFSAEVSVGVTGVVGICRPRGTCTAMCRCTCSGTRGSIWRSCISTAASTSSNCTIRRM